MSMERKHFPDFYRKNVKRIYRFLYFRTRGNKEVAEDLTQDVFVKCLAAFDSYDPAVSASSWIFTIARNHLINYLQKEKPSVALEDIENNLWDRQNWGEKMTFAHDEKRLLDAISRLNPDDAEIVRLKYLEGWPYEDIAELRGKNAGALRVQAHRALKELRGILKQL